MEEKHTKARRENLQKAVSFSYGCHDSRGEYTPPWHYHDIYEIFISLSENQRYLVGNRIYELPVGSVLLLNSFDVHLSLPPEKGSYKRYMVLFQREFLSPWNNVEEDILRLFQHRQADFVHFRPCDKEQYEKLESLVCRGIGMEQMRDRNEKLMLQRCLLVEIMLFLNRLFDLNPSQNRNRRNNHLEPVLDYIRDNLGNDLSLGHLAETFGASVNTLNNRFQKQLSLSAKQYILQMRIQHARLLLYQGVDVTAAALESGFGNLSHFIRIFKAKTGKTPGEFAREAFRADGI